MRPLGRQWAEGGGANELLKQIDHLRLAGNFFDGSLMIFGHEQGGFFAAF